MGSTGQGVIPRIAVCGWVVRTSESLLLRGHLLLDEYSPAFSHPRLPKLDKNLLGETSTCAEGSPVSSVWAQRRLRGRIVDGGFFFFFFFWNGSCRTASLFLRGRRGKGYRLLIVLWKHLHKYSNLACRSMWLEFDEDGSMVGCVGLGRLER